MQTYSFPVAFDFYAPCIGGIVSVNGVIHARGHTFETNSGVVHIVDHWAYDYLASDASGREWYEIGQVTIVNNIRLEKGMVSQGSPLGHFKPLTDDTPQFFVRFRTKMTVNANGELVVFVDFETDPNVYVKCVGPNY